MYKDVHLNLVMEIIKSIPDILSDDSGYVLKPYPDNSQQYTKHNCKKFGVPFLENFVDIDTYISENRMRIQGIYPVKGILGLYLSVEELEFLLTMITTGHTEWVQGRTSDKVYDNTYTLRVSAYSVIADI